MKKFYCESCDYTFETTTENKDVVCPLCGLKDVVKEVIEQRDAGGKIKPKRRGKFFVCKSCGIRWKDPSLTTCPKCKKDSNIEVVYELF